jgi:hypothetical protein
MYAADIRPATVVTVFLNPRPNIKLRPKLRSELRPSSRVVSYIWNMGTWTPDAVRTLNGRRIYLWRIPPSSALALFPRRRVEARDHVTRDIERSLVP